MLKLFKTAVIVLCFFCLGLGPKENSVTAEAGKRTVKTGEVFSYTIKIEGEFEQPRIILPELKNFRIVSQSKSKRHSFKDKTETSAVKLIYFLFAPEPGAFTITPAVVEDNGKEFKSKSVTIQVKGAVLKEDKKILPYIESGIEI